MPCSRPLLLALVPALSLAQQPRKIDALHELSNSLERLAQRVNRGIVKIVSVGYTLGSEDEESTNPSVLTRQRSLGTGVLLSPDGYIVTNAHLVQGSRRLRVQLPVTDGEISGRQSVIKPSGRIVDARVAGVDRETDLAVLKVNQTGLAHLSLGNSEALRPGQLVLAFGNPLGLQNSVSMGVVSSTARQIKTDDPTIYIQTDASINPGNSGGPLVDVEGNVVGINTFILSQSGGSEGIGFAIPSNIVKTVFEQIRQDGHVHRGQVGVRAQTLTPALAQGLGIPRDSGVLVGDVTPAGPAEQAGLRIGDVILAMDGKPMENARQFEVNVYRHSVGDKLRLALLRGGRQLEMQVAVDEREDDPQRFADLVDAEKNQIRKLGILGIEITAKVSELLPDLRRPYGVVVAARIAGAPNAADLQPGDVIHGINGAPIATIAALRDLLEKQKADTQLVMQVERDGKMMYQVLELE